MKIPAYLRQPVYAPGTCGLRFAARILEVEAKLYRRGGQKEAATALLNTAACLKRIKVGTRPDVIFDWPMDERERNEIKQAALQPTEIT